MTPQHESSGREKLNWEGSPHIFAMAIRSGDSWRDRENLVAVVEESKRGTSLCEVPLFVWIGSPGRTRTCDQPVTSAPIFQPGLDYLFTRLQYMQGRVSGANEALLDGFRSL